MTGNFFIRHTKPIILYGNAVLVCYDIDILRLRVVCVGNQFRQHIIDVGIKARPKQFKDAWFDAYVFSLIYIPPIACLLCIVHCIHGSTQTPQYCSKRSNFNFATWYLLISLRFSGVPKIIFTGSAHIPTFRKCAFISSRYDSLITSPI